MQLAFNKAMLYKGQTNPMYQTQYQMGPIELSRYNNMSECGPH